jgi:hypothetical protein
MCWWWDVIVDGGGDDVNEGTDEWFKDEVSEGSDVVAVRAEWNDGEKVERGEATRDVRELLPAWPLCMWQEVL